MLDSTYKIPNSKFSSLNQLFDKFPGSDDEVVEEIISSLNILFNSDLKESVSVIHILIHGIDKASLDFQKYIFNADFIQRLICLCTEDVQNIYKADIFEMILFVISKSQNQRSDLALDFSISSFLYYTQNNLTPKYLPRIINCLSLLITKDNYERIKLQDLINGLRYVCQISLELKCVSFYLVSKLSLFIPIKYEYSFFVKFIRDSFEYISLLDAPYLYKSLKHLIKSCPSDLGPASWMIIRTSEFTKFDHNVHIIVYKICCTLQKESINNVLTEPNVKKCLIDTLLSEMNDDRIPFGIRALVHYMKVDPENCISIYFSDDILYKLSSRFINNLQCLIYKLKCDSGILLCFLMKFKPQIFLQGLCKSYEIINMNRMKGEINAIITILEIEDMEITLYLLNGLLAICHNCELMCLKEELSETFYTKGILSEIEKIIYKDKVTEEMIALVNSILSFFQ